MQLSFDSVTNRSCAVIPIEDDSIYEQPENFPVEISSPDPDVTTIPDTAAITIMDNDGNQ